MSRAYHHGDVRGEAIAAARALCEAQGQVAVTMRAVAKEVGVDHRAIYRHFADRETLLAEVAALGFADLLATMNAEDGEATLHRDFAASIRFALDHPHLYALMLSRPRSLMLGGGALEAAVRGLLEQLMRSASTALGDETPEDVRRDMVFAALGSSYGLITLAASMTLAPRSRDELEAFLIRQVSSVIDGQILQWRAR